MKIMPNGRGVILKKDIVLVDMREVASPSFMNPPLNSASHAIVIFLCRQHAQYTRL